ncbi:MAG: hypothetical protein GMKNLPBB_00319 [Myxococcota bacterium]|nr:hypothetical protein [Myxococcota bacterium]
MNGNSGPAESPSIGPITDMDTPAPGSIVEALRVQVQVPTEEIP